jgi:hypothetical protein
MKDFIEQQIIEAVRGLLTGRVNEIFGDWQFLIPIIEFSNFQSMSTVVPVIALSGCERSEKERIILLDAYSLTITFNVPETADSELFCYGYGAAVDKALGENPTLGGVADRVVVTNKKYVPPKVANSGMEWQVIISLRITVEQ